MFSKKTVRWNLRAEDTMVISISILLRISMSLSLSLPFFSVLFYVFLIWVSINVSPSLLDLYQTISQCVCCDSCRSSSTCTVILLWSFFFFFLFLSQWPLVSVYFSSTVFIMWDEKKVMQQKQIDDLIYSSLFIVLKPFLDWFTPVFLCRCLSVHSFFFFVLSSVF